jgi:hypothetical protein
LNIYISTPEALYGVAVGNWTGLIGAAPDDDIDDDDDDDGIIRV